MTDPPDTGSPHTEPIPAGAAVPATDAAPTEPLEPTAPTETADATATSRLDYESPTVVLSPLDTDVAPASAAFTRARWAEAREKSGEPSAPPPQDITPVPLPAVDPGGSGAGKTRANPTPPPHTLPAAVPAPPGAAAGAHAPAAPTRPPMVRATAPAPRRRRPRRRPRLGTILWGVLLLGFAVFMVAWTVLPVPPDPTFWLLGGVILLGLLLVVAGIAAASRRAG